MNGSEIIRENGRNTLGDVVSSFFRPPLKSLPTLSGPALILGSGPGASVPIEYDARWSLATVNASQAIAHRLGIGPPRFTLLGAAVMKSNPVNMEAQSAMRGGTTGILMCLKGRRRFTTVPWKLAALQYSYDEFFYLNRTARLRAIEAVLGHPVPNKDRPSNGVVLAFLCLEMGLSPIVMTGFSLTKVGHAYNDKKRDRRHVEEDRYILGKAAERGAPIFTNDPVFAEESRLPLYRSSCHPTSASPEAVGVR